MTDTENVTSIGPELLVGFDLIFVKEYIAFMCIVGTLLLLLAFKETPINRITKRLPKSCILIVIGLALAWISHHFDVFKEVNHLITSRVFFYILIPPIILDSAFQLYCEHFIFQLGNVMLLAVVGSIINIFMIGIIIYGTFGIFNELTILECIMLSSILSAVDPVAVLAVMSQIGVRKRIYFLIFGESLFNDGVTVAIFDTVKKISGLKTIPTSTIMFAVFSFVPIAVGGLFIGLVYGMFISFFCKFTSSKSRSIESSIIYVAAYSAFLNAQMIHWSGILALIGFGLSMQRYGFENISKRTEIAVEDGITALGSLTEALIFLMFGFKLLDFGFSHWNGWLISVAIGSCIVSRFFSTFLLCWIINLTQADKLTYREQIFMSYGGLRGAMSFAMAVSMPESPLRNLFVGTVLATILITVLGGGSTVKLVVDLLNLEEKAQVQTFTNTSLKYLKFHTMAGMETILGSSVGKAHRCLEVLDVFDRKYIQRIFCRSKSQGRVFSHMLHECYKSGICHHNHLLWKTIHYAREKLSEESRKG